jgi:hypothetical protein
MIFSFSGLYGLYIHCYLLKGKKLTSFSHEPLYVSKRMSRNLWQEYRVFSDRIEIQCRFLFSTFVIPFDDIEEVSLSRALAIEIFRGKAWKGGLPWKLDFANIYTHIVIRRISGLFRNIRFTPDDPALFLSVCRQAQQELKIGLDAEGTVPRHR